jgi:hypothetical protein
MRRVFSLDSYKDKISIIATGSKQWADGGHATIPLTFATLFYRKLS